jgi:two-component system NarL family sensor kinase
VEIRRISQNLRPSVLDDLGLSAAVKGLCEELAKRTKIKISLDIPERNIRFSEIIELTIFRVIQEALNNIERHSKATQVEIAISDLKDTVVASVSDNGRGVQSHPSRKHRVDGSGTGIAGMSERVSYLGGQFEIDSQPRKGTRVFVRIPKTMGNLEKNLEA